MDAPAYQKSTRIMSKESKEELDYILNHLGEERENYHGATVPPIFQTSNFIFPSVDAFSRAFTDEYAHHLYTRGNNPTVRILCDKLAALERTPDAMVFPSGMAAIAMAVMSFVKAGDHILCIRNPYSWTSKLLLDYLPRFGISVDFFEGNNIDELNALVTPATKMLIVESPNTMTFDVVDLRAIGEWCRSHDILSLIDNSYASPLYQNPFELGIDLVCHSGTKYLNGHSDVVFGVVCGSEEHLERIRHWGMMTLGSTMSPFEASMVIRGLRTLKVRLAKISDTTSKVFHFLEAQDWVEQVYYPFDPNSNQYELAKSQMKAAPGLISFVLKTTEEGKIQRFIEGLKYFKMAVSWGGHESLIIPLMAIHKAHPDQEHVHSSSFIRIYIGLEDEEALIGDLQNASKYLN